MFVLTATHLFWWPATALAPDPETAGKFREHQFKLQFEALGLDEAQAMDEAFHALNSEKDRQKHQHDLLYRVVKGWSEVVDVEKAPVPFSAGALEQAIQLAWFRTAAYRAYAEAMSGEKARLGN